MKVKKSKFYFRKSGRDIIDWVQNNYRVLIFWGGAALWFGTLIWCTELWAACLISIVAVRQWRDFTRWCTARPKTKLQKTIENLHKRFDDLIFLWILQNTEFQDAHPTHFKPRTPVSQGTEEK